jgi:succinate dehydrogenase / fumarate reductase flavoprotein subunit
VRREKCRVLVVGGGLAGLQAAEVATQFVDEVVLVDEGSEPSSARDASMVAVYLAIEESGGLASPYFNRVRAALQPPVPADKLPQVAQAYRDFSRAIIEHGGGRSDPTLVELTVDGIYNRIGWMEAYGLHWARTPNKAFAGLHASGHRGASIAYLQEEPAAVMGVLKAGARHLDGRFLDRIWITRLFVSDGRVQGAYAIDLTTGNPVVFEAPVVILAAGGADRLYSETGSSGDGALLAADAGAALANLEFVRFVPQPEDAKPTESRELGLLLLGLGLKLENMRSPFPKEVRERALQIAPLRSFAQRAGDVIQWRIACAGILGGVAHTLFATKVNGLFVAGECSTGIHGADALAGMTTSYNFCSGEEAGIRAAKQSLKTERPRISDKQIDAEAQRLSARVGKRSFDAQSEARIRRVMWDGAGPTRQTARLKVALKELDGLVDALAAAQAPSAAELRPLIEAQNLARLGTMVCQAALDHR